MKINSELHRRQFLRRSASIGVAAKLAGWKMLSAQESPNDRITVGMIGVGARAHELLRAIQAIPGTEIVGVCDAYQGRLERAVERTRGRAKIYPDYHAILEDKGIDAVIIATPDHWHKTMVVEALKAGKDIYVEKPLTYTIDDGVEIIAEVKRSDRILQVGSQGISSRIQQKAKELIQSGRVGQVTLLRASYNRNTAGGAWIYPIPPDASPQTVNWEMFLGMAPSRAYDPARFFRWRCYWDYSGGIATDLFVHLATTIHFLMNAKAPQNTVALGTLYRWKDSREVPDTLNAVLEYPEGFSVNLSSTFNNQMSGGEQGFQILGTEGSLVLGGGGLTFYPEHTREDNRWIVESWPRKLQDAYYQDPKVLKAEVASSWVPKVSLGMERWEEDGKDAVVTHLEQFFECVRQRRQPLEDALTGHRAAAVAHLVNLSYQQKRLVSWDYQQEKVKS
jgi:predicted dehydrogenase